MKTIKIIHKIQNNNKNINYTDNSKKKLNIKKFKINIKTYK